MYKELFPEKLREARNEAGYTQQQVAELLNIPRATLANYETGRTEPDLEILGKLIDFYEIPARWIIGTKH